MISTNTFDFGRAGQRVKIFCRNLVKDFLGTGCQKSAAALTYMTLFALVPLMTVAYRLVSFFPQGTDLLAKAQGYVFENYVPVAGEEVQGYLVDFSSQAKNLTAFGIAMLVVTAYLMLTNIEKTFNNIWGVTQARKGLSSFLLYWAVLSLGPLLICTAIFTSAYLLSLKFMVDGMETLGLTTSIYRIFPILMTGAAFTLLFIAVPNCRVPFKYAAIGGFVTASVLEVLKFGFASLVANSSFELIYGAFAFVPLFLLWINLMWMIILAGAIFVRTLAERSYTHLSGRMTDMIVALQALELMYEKSRDGLAVTDNDCYRLGIGVVHWQKLRQIFVKQRWIAVTRGDRYVLCRDLRSVTLWDLAIILELSVNDLDETISKNIDKPWFKRYLEKRKSMLERSQSALDDSVESLFTLQEHE